MEESIADRGGLEEFKALALRAQTDFLAGKARNSWVQAGPVRAYLRRSVRRLGGGQAPCLDLASIEIEDGSRGRGFGRAFVEMLERAALGRPDLEWVYVENVLERRFADFFARRGYAEVFADEAGSVCMARKSAPGG